MVSQMGRQLYLIGDDQITIGTVTPVIAFPPQAHLRSRLCLWLYFQLDLRTSTQLDHHLTAQQGCVEIDVHIGVHLPPALATETLCASLSTATTEQILEEAAEATAVERAEIKTIEG